MGRSSEISTQGIGAFARRQRRVRVLLAVFGLGLVAVAGGVYWSLRPPTTGAPVVAQVRVRCAACGAERSVAVRRGEGLPEVCPACGARGVQEVWACRECNAKFVVAGAEPVCPRCGSRRVGAAMAP